MSRILLSRAAADDLREIRRYTRDRFGVRQAIKIRGEFQEIFKTLARAPFSAPRKEEFDPPGKAFRYCSSLPTFIIVYEPVDKGIRVARVLHGARNLASELERDAGTE